MAERTSGTRTFVFTDIEGSTRLLHALRDEYADVLRRHDRIVRSAAEAHGGEAFGSEGDAQHLVFTDAAAAVRAAAQAQRDLAVERWPLEGVVRVRMGVHTGDVQLDGAAYVGLALHETARITSAGHGGQVLLSSITAELVRERLPEGTGLHDLGEQRLRDFERPVRIFQLDIDGLADEHPPLRTQAAALVRLPQPPTPFVGRDEVESAVELASSTRLLTLTGPGGTGKTRLSIAVAERLAPRFADGTWFVALDAVGEAPLVASEIVSTLGLSAGSGAPIDRLIEHLASRSVLLVLDNLEQVIDAAPDVARILRECPEVAVIATSRIPLRIYGEQELPVPALSLPHCRDAATLADVEGFEAVRLFEQRARAARPAFALADGDAAAICEVVTRLDGLPLAIELAAARMRTLPLEALRSRLNDSLGLLSGGARDLPSRQQTLRGAIGWSHDLLDEPARRLFARFGVFAGSGSLAQVEAIAGPAAELGRDVFDGLESLAEQSLLRVVDDDEEPRFAMLATIREYARERLAETGESERIGKRHAIAYLELAEGLSSGIMGPDGAQVSARLEREHDDLRAALDWCVANDEAELALRFVVALWRFWQVHGHLHEATERTRSVLAMPSVAAQPPALRSRAEGAAGGVAYWRSQWDRTRRHYEAALELARESGDEKLLAESLYNAGFAPPDGVDDWVAGATEREPYFREALGLFEADGDLGGIARASWALALAAASRDDLAGAGTLALRGLTAARAVGDRYYEGWALHTYGLSRLAAGDVEGAAASIGESLELWVAAGDLSGVSLLLLDCAAVARDRGRDDVWWRLFGAAERLRRETGTDLIDSSVEFPLLRLRRAPETAEEQGWYGEGQGLDMASAIELARHGALAPSGRPRENLPVPSISPALIRPSPGDRHPREND